MRAALKEFEPGTSVDTLDRLVGELSGLIESLVGSVDVDLVEDMRSAWWPLEFVNAIVLSEERERLTEAEIEAASTARDEFLALLAERRSL